MGGVWEHYGALWVVCGSIMGGVWEHYGWCVGALWVVYGSIRERNYRLKKKRIIYLGLMPALHGCSACSSSGHKGGPQGQCNGHDRYHTLSP